MFWMTLNSFNLYRSNKTRYNVKITSKTFKVFFECFIFTFTSHVFCIRVFLVCVILGANKHFFYLDILVQCQ